MISRLKCSYILHQNFASEKPKQIIDLSLIQDISWLCSGYCCRIYSHAAAPNPECQRSSPRVALRAEAPFRRPDFAAAASCPRIDTAPSPAVDPGDRPRIWRGGGETATVATDGTPRQELRTAPGASPRRDERRPAGSVPPPWGSAASAPPRLVDGVHRRPGLTIPVTERVREYGKCRRTMW